MLYGVLKIWLILKLKIRKKVLDLRKKWDLKILLREVLKLGGLDGAKEPEGARGRDGRISQALYF